MNKVLAAAAVMLLSAIPFSARAAAHYPQSRAEHFAAQQMNRPLAGRHTYRSHKLRAFSALPQQANRQAEQPKMRPGRNYDNPAAFRFGEGSRPNRYIWGSSRKYREAQAGFSAY